MHEVDVTFESLGCLLDLACIAQITLVGERDFRVSREVDIKVIRNIG